MCESTSLRQVVEPGLFFLVRAAESTRAKPSARAVAHLADLVVVSDGRSFDLDLDRISVVDGQWAFRREACAVVIDGTGSRHEADRTAALRHTRASLEAQFDRVVILPERAARSTFSVQPTGLPNPPEDWCLVTPPVAGGVPPGLVNAMFRRRAEVDVVVAAARSEGRGLRLALCRRQRLPEAIAALGRGPDAAAALGDRCAVTELRLESTGSGSELERLPATAPRAPASGPATRVGAETL